MNTLSRKVKGQRKGSAAPTMESHSMPHPTQAGIRMAVQAVHCDRRRVHCACPLSSSVRPPSRVVAVRGWVLEQRCEGLRKRPLGKRLG